MSKAYRVGQRLAVLQNIKQANAARGHLAGEGLLIGSRLMQSKPVRGLLDHRGMAVAPATPIAAAGSVPTAAAVSSVASHAVPSAAAAPGLAEVATQKVTKDPRNAVLLRDLLLASTGGVAGAGLLGVTQADPRFRLGPFSID